MIILTGDTHGNFDRIREFCMHYGTTKEDTMIVLGDAGINYWLDSRDNELKCELSKLPVTLFCIHGSHEERPEEISTYGTTKWRGGTIFLEDEYPTILFARDGEEYDLNGKKAIVIGGGYSNDKCIRLRNGDKWFESEQPNQEIKYRVERKLDDLDWNVSYVLSHTAPLKYQPIAYIDQCRVDKSTEEWLDEIEDRLDYEHWFCGHFHADKNMGSIRFMFEDFFELV